ncbi:SPOR domain-containing protein [Paludibacterium paludis]|uniref:SPOR domain-containing protein n=1 Tax=Paludibacterium paludis TaxID=1225769 RepID=A0A918NY04_9NEIS|nr:SPOR domain-containing protein [Paludibacterium paludis]GGY05376.1 hypothetical protein GCM10011289_05020 [Paludibacterium paludis]
MAMKENPNSAPDERLDDDTDSSTRIKTRLAIAAGLAVVALAAIPLIDSVGNKKSEPAPAADPSSGRIAAIAPPPQAQQPASAAAAQPAPAEASVPAGAPRGPDVASTPGMQVTPGVKLPATLPAQTPAPQTSPTTRHEAPPPRPAAPPSLAHPQVAAVPPAARTAQADLVPQPAPLAARAEPAPATQARAKPAGSSLGYNVQLGLFSSLGNAQKMIEELKAKGIEVHTETRLHVGPFRSRAEAEETQAKLRALGYTPLLVPAGG